MSKITISAVLAILNLVCKLFYRSLTLIDVICDLVDDGELNGTNESTKFHQFRTKVEDIITEIGNFTTDYSNSI